MYKFFTIISIIDPFFSILVGLFVFLKNPFKNLNFSFFAFTWLITIWSMLSYALYLNQGNFLLYKLNFSFGAACFLATVPWIIYLVKENPNRKLIVFMYILSLFLLAVPFIDKTLFTNLVLENSIYNFEIGFSYYIYAGIVSLSIIYIFYLLIKSIIRFTGNARKKTIFVLAGFSIFVFWEIAVGIVMPLLNIPLGPEFPYGSIGDTILFVGLSSYGLIKYQSEAVITPDII